jgi:glycosyltransferase involved in cell wall biosynthesis
MLQKSQQSRCLTYCSLPYAGVGWPQTCVSILEGFGSEALQPVLALPRTRALLPATIETIPGLTPPASVLPWRYVSGMAASALQQRFIGLLNRADPATSIAYFWPGTPLAVIEHARARGIITVREMINTFQGTAKRILDGAYGQVRLPVGHNISAAAVAAERHELALYDWICAPSPLVEASLLEAGIPRGNIIPTSFGWSPARFGHDLGQFRPAARNDVPINLLFVGSIGVRKGVPELLAAWAKAGVAGTLTLVGDVEPAVVPMLEEAKQSGSVKVLPFTRDVGALFRSHDIFVFPTHEEGAPQVTFEAGGCGLAIITTPMGAARLVKDGVNGIVIPAGAPADLAAAIVLLASDPALRERYSRRIAADAQAFTYDRLGAQRAVAFIDRLKHRHSEVVSYA